MRITEERLARIRRADYWHGVETGVFSIFAIAALAGGVALILKAYIMNLCG